jgi:ribonuclease R
MRKSKEPRRAELTEEALLRHLEAGEYEPASQRELFHLLNLSKQQRSDARRLIKRLLETGRIVKISRGRLVVSTSDAPVTGILQRHRRGFGFVIPEAGGEHVFIPPGRMRSALNGDLVAVRITRRGPGDKIEGELVKVLERRGDEMLGVYLRQGRGGVFQAFDESLGVPTSIPNKSAAGAAHRQVVKIKLVKAPRASQPGEAAVTEILGDLDDPQTEIQVVCRKFNLPGAFPEAALAEARELPTRVGPGDKQRRKRFDDPAPVTIDGATAQDFDDAIAVKELPRGGFRLFVHVADVAHFVKAGSALDEEARLRGTSVYFPGKVIPMFPEALSNGLCSLRPGVDRLVQSVVIDFDAAGAVKKTAFADGIIHSAARLTYTQVASVLAGEAHVKAVPHKVLPMLAAASRLRKVLHRRRVERGSIDFDLPMPELQLDADGVLTGITMLKRNDAHLLIEEFMLAANEAVAGRLKNETADCMYRNHDDPDPVKLQALSEFVKRFDLPFDARSAGSVEIQQMLKGVEGRVDYPVISMVVLRSMKQAAYAMTPSGHFGLATDTYCHFTSPIRRYPDLVNHRLLREKRRGVRTHRLRDELDLEAVAQRSTELERTAEAAERELTAWKKLILVEGREGETFDGVISGVAAFGLFVQLTASLVDGLIRVDRSARSDYEFNERKLELRHKKSGKIYRLGDPVRVRLERVDRVLRRVDFKLVRS